MAQARPWTFLVVSAVSVGALVVISCGTGSGARVPRVTVPRAVVSMQSLYEAGRYREVVEAVARSTGAVSPEDSWLAGQSYLRLALRGDARAQFERLEADSSDPAWRTVARLALSQFNGDAGAFDGARADANVYPTHAFVQYQLGLALSANGEFEEAARALDRCIEADPRFAYAYYDAGLVYQRLDRADLATTRLEGFVRLAPNAPERPAVESVLRTMRGR